MGFRLSFRNIGIFSEFQSIDIEPLTVIAGENDTGKSTVGKLLFALLKAHFMSSGGYFFKSWKNYLQSKTDTIKGDLQRILTDRKTYRLLSSALDEFVGKVVPIVTSRRPYREKKALISREVEKLKASFLEKGVDPALLESIMYSTTDKFRNIHRCQTFRNLLDHLFFKEFLNKLSENDTASVKFEYLSGKLEATIRGKFVESFYATGDLPFRDVTFVDTPVIFQLIKFLSEEEVLNIEYTPTIKDLRRKLHDREFPLTAWEKSELLEIVEKIMNIIRADIIQEEDGAFKLKKEGLEIRLENAATGIKSFAIPLVLLRKGWLRSNTIFVIDEPEVHLHPIWQVRYAEILTLLAKRGIFVIITTHSPYVLKALIIPKLVYN